MAEDAKPVGESEALKPANEVRGEGAVVLPSAPPPDGIDRVATVLGGGRSNGRTALYLAGGVFLVLLLAAGGIYAWKVWAVQGLERRFAAERSQLSTVQRQALDGQARYLLRLGARPFAWAVRAELLRGNVGQVDDYFREFVRERGVNSVLLVGPDQKILLATNRKLETQAADGLVSKTILEAPDVIIEEAGGLLRLGVPVMGFDRRLGLLVIEYDPAAQR